MLARMGAIPNTLLRQLASLLRSKPEATDHELGEALRIPAETVKRLRSSDMLRAALHG